MNKNIRSAMIGLVALLTLPMAAIAEDALAVKTVSEVFAQKETLAGQRIVLVGKAVKVSNGIMGKNFVHIQDGTGAEGTNNLIITSQQTATVGDELRVEALVTLNRDFGFGYLYPLILEEANLTPAK